MPSALFGRRISWQARTTWTLLLSNLPGHRPCSLPGVPDRRRDSRFKLAEPAEGSLTVFPDIVVQEVRDGEWIAISREPAAIGETLVLDTVLHAGGNGAVRERFPVCVIDCQSLVIDGNLRHRIRLYGDYNARILFDQQMKRG